ncbi:MAG TPA: alpha/beta hydrolase-fold protein [Candidatus Paceibacterota bacterium]|nr:alpha/beta hydrolase-fold protein [Candidatus Paceibacterota bacterium]
MNSNLLRAAAIVASCLALPSLASAQSQRAPQIESPIVHPDRTVTFNFGASSAKKVELSSQFTRGNQPFQRGSNGVWSVTVGPVEPNLYPYNFVVDGVSVADPANMDLFPNERFKSSLVDIPGDKPAIYSAQNVPHGVVSYCFYHSARLGVRPLLVYTPPSYRESTEKFPVFYLVSGTTDTEETWFKVGRVNFILDNLIAQKKAVPMVVVMPYGNMMNGTPDPTTMQAADMYKAFTEELVGGIMPFVEGQYRVSSDRTKRAIAGFSRGGGQSLFAGFSNLDKFAWIGSYSAYLTPEVFNRCFSALAESPEATNQRLKLLWLGVGSEDFLYRQAVTFDEFLKEKKIEHKSLITGGGHTWMNARHYLAETLPLYFK